MPTSGSRAVIHPHEARARKEAEPRELPQTSPKTASKTQPDRIRYQDRKVSPKVMGRGIPHTWLVSHNLLLPHKENALKILTARPNFLAISILAMVSGLNTLAIASFAFLSEDLEALS